MLFVDLWQSPIVGFTHYETCLNDKEIQLENKIKDLEQYLKKIKEMEVQYEYENFSQELSISIELPRAKARGFLFHWKQP